MFWAFPFCFEVTEDLFRAYPAGGRVVVEQLYTRQETIARIFQRNQKLWNILKRVIRDIDRYCKIHGLGPESISVWELAKADTAFKFRLERILEFPEVHSDEMDIFLWQKTT